MVWHWLTYAINLALRVSYRIRESEGRLVGRCSRSRCVILTYTRLGMTGTPTLLLLSDSVLILDFNIEDSQAVSRCLIFDQNPSTNWDLSTVSWIIFQPQHTQSGRHRQTKTYYKSAKNLFKATQKHLKARFTSDAFVSKTTIILHIHDYDIRYFKHSQDLLLNLTTTTLKSFFA